MSRFDIIEIPGHPGMYARRVIVEAWQAAGSPPINDAGRLYAKQKKAWDDFQAGTGSPADDPDRPNLFELAHVRFVALDITPTAERVRRLSAAGLVRPYKYEPWHWRVADPYTYPLVTALPAPTTPEEPDMTTEEHNALMTIAAFVRDLADRDGITSGTEDDQRRSLLVQGLEASIDLWDRYVTDEDGNGSKDYDLMQLTQNRVLPTLRKLQASLDELTKRLPA